MADLISIVKEKARKRKKRIIFPEGDEERVLRATEIIQKEKIAYSILLGNEKEILSKSKDLGLNINFDNIEIYDPNKLTAQKAKYIKEFYKIRKSKGVTEQEAEELMENLDYYGVMSVQMGDADGMVSGSRHRSTADTVKPALQIIKTKEKFHKVSGVFFMVLENRLLLFADCAVTIDPNSFDLAGIGEDTAETAKRFGMDPRIAFLSFSTKGSTVHPMTQKMSEATAILKDKRPDLVIDGELQVDAALIPWVAEKKCPNSPLQGNANVLIFPDIQAANIAYKLVQRLAGAQAIGPILQGLKKPVNDLSRGCSVEDIVNVSAFTACEVVEPQYKI
ncbi:MAG: Phosphate acetyltransferase [Candidatus Peregrinibacteria bacterium GW2011_GWA2_38_36]|nr:MAG: Phosphate acetyltransferase [Candidatus Peregrinibacteria bacterium GW2011_GWA2_38_36]